MNATVIVGWYLIAAVVLFALIVCAWAVGYTAGRKQGRSEGVRAARALSARFAERLKSRYTPHDPPASGHPHGRI